MMKQLLLPRDVIRRSSVLGTSTSGKWGITFTQIMGRNMAVHALAICYSVRWLWLQVQQLLCGLSTPHKSWSIILRGGTKVLQSFVEYQSLRQDLGCWKALLSRARASAPVRWRPPSSASYSNPPGSRPFAG
jgi:hypothetical protein